LGEVQKENQIAAVWHAGGLSTTHPTVMLRDVVVATERGWSPRGVPFGYDMLRK